MKTFIGIDPGAKGAIAFITDEGVTGAYSNSKHEPASAFAEIFSTFSDGKKTCVAVLEKVGGFMGGKDNRFIGPSMFKLGESYGYMQGVLAMAGIRTILVRPQDWQKGITGLQGKKGLERKRALKAEAIRRFPDINVTLENCDALLIAEYCKKTEG